VGYWTGVMVPAGASDKLVSLLNRKITKVISAPDVQERLAKIGFDPMPGTIQSFADHIKAESDEWGRVVRQANIKIE
jgi:tripartite-type tricarboxylate transporter receptor subunit TctC